MSENPSPYQPDDNEEIFWIVTSFLAQSPKVQSYSINYFNLTISDLAKDIHSQILKNIAWCFGTYMPDYLGDAVFRPSMELDSLLRLMMNFDILSQNRGIPDLWNSQSLKTNELWSIARRLARVILTEWGMDLYEFADMIDLDYIGMEEEFGVLPK